MAHLHPSVPTRSALDLGDRAELDVLERLRHGLSDAYTLFHSIDWTGQLGSQLRRGEVDIAVVNQAGDVLLLEIKAGGVEFTPEGIFKRYGHQLKNVGDQVRLQHSGVLSRLQRAGIPAQVSNLLVLTDARVAVDTLTWPRERIVDAESLADLPARVQRELGPGLPRPAVHRQVLDFFGDLLHLQPDVSVLSGRLTEASARMSSGLATWVPRLHLPSGLLRVVGTAGSGKTQLALQLLRQADAAGQRAAYVCFNRALSDHMARLVPVRVSAENFHQMADRLARRDGVLVDHTQPGAFEQLAQHAQSALSQAEPDLDVLVIDEMQDMQPAWMQALLQRLRADGRVTLLEDPEQQLYADREPFAIEGEATLHTMENYRSPRVLVRLSNALSLTDQPVEALGPWEGELADPLVVSTGGIERLRKATVQAVQRCLDRGYSLEEIAVLSLHGRGSSRLLNDVQLGPWSLRRFTGQYDASGEPIWTQGQLVIDTVYRFKGQSAPAVVLTECDFEEWSEKTKRVLFVGLTRARMHLEWVISDLTERLLTAAIASKQDF